jgi:hexokinase
MRVENFLAANKLRTADINIDDLVTVFTEEMDFGLAGNPSSLRMIPTYIEAENEFLTDTPVLAIDAGGTNFRTALITFGSDGKVHSGQIGRFIMPGLDREISANKFFETIAEYIAPMAEKTERIGFCFSYPTEILPSKDGRLLQFCKEIQAPEVVGQLIGKRLLETLGTPSKKIVLLNDTVATLLAGKSASQGRKYDSYIGYILGTGTNTCYIEQNRNITKNQALDKSASQIINVESGNFKKGPRSLLDREFDSTTSDPGNYSFEKMFAGGYFGGLCLSILKSAASEGIFSDSVPEKLMAISDLTSEEANNFLQEKEGRLDIAFNDRESGDAARIIIDCLIDRAACLAAANIAGPVLKTGKGKNPGNPILVTIEGTAFYRLHNLKSRFEDYLDSYLDGERKRYLEFTEVENSSLLGAALAGLID